MAYIVCSLQLQQENKDITLVPINYLLPAICTSEPFLLQELPCIYGNSSNTYAFKFPVKP